MLDKPCSGINDHAVSHEFNVNEPTIYIKCLKKEIDTKQCYVLIS